MDLLKCDTTRQRLIDTCQSLWNKVGDFCWNYQRPHPFRKPDMNTCGEQADHWHRLPTSSSIPKDSLNLFFKAPNDNVPEIMYPALTEHLQASHLTHDNGFVSTSEPWLSGYGTEDLFAKFTYLPATVYSTTCSLCSGDIPSNEPCPTCFGPLLGASDHRDTALLEVPLSISGAQHAEPPSYESASALEWYEDLSASCYLSSFGSLSSYTEGSRAMDESKDASTQWSPTDLGDASRPITSHVTGAKGPLVEPIFYRNAKKQVVEQPESAFKHSYDFRPGTWFCCQYNDLNSRQHPQCTVVRSDGCPCGHTRCPLCKKEYRLL